MLYLLYLYIFLIYIYVKYSSWKRTIDVILFSKLCLILFHQNSEIFSVSWKKQSKDDEVPDPTKLHLQERDWLTEKSLLTPVMTRR